MRNPEIRQKGESPEDYVRRISKFPILSPNTILRAVFPAVRLDTLRYIKDCARSEFPNSFPPEDNKGIPFIDPEDISTKAFAKWVAEEDIFETLRSLTEKPSPTAELFIELVNGKASSNGSKKVKRKKPHSSTDRGRLDDFKNDKFIPLVEQVLKENPDWQNPQILEHKKVADALDNCGFPEGKPSEKAIKNWIGIARTNTGSKAKIGRPPN
jgi:hypothetical protein